MPQAIGTLPTPRPAQCPEYFENVNEIVIWVSTSDVENFSVSRSIEFYKNDQQLQDQALENIFASKIQDYIDLSIKENVSIVTKTEKQLYFFPEDFSRNQLIIRIKIGLKPQNGVDSKKFIGAMYPLFYRPNDDPSNFCATGFHDQSSGTYAPKLFLLDYNQNKQYEDLFNAIDRSAKPLSETINLNFNK